LRKNSILDEKTSPSFFFSLAGAVSKKKSTDEMTKSGSYNCVRIALYETSGEHRAGEQGGYKGPLCEAEG